MNAVYAAGDGIFADGVGNVRSLTTVSARWAEVVVGRRVVLSARAADGWSAVVVQSVLFHETTSRHVTRHQALGA